jgi:adenine-specific DNA-methyltransferase
MQNLYKDLIQELAKNEKFLLQGQVSASLVRDKAYKLDPELVGLLFGSERLKQEFFTETNGAMIFNYPKFAKFITNKEFLPDSYTEFESNIGLSVGDKFLSENKEVVLSFPFKDCILEGGMDTEEAKNRKEIFYNQTLAPDDIHKLKSPKALKSFEKHTVKGKEEVRELKLKDDGTFNENFIIKGNNLLALYSLLPRYKGKVKLIYIDPPYNTGNDGFRYNDNFNHSTWLTFMKNRLEVARELLRNDGSIFISIDDREFAYLKILCDEIFGEYNFLSDIIWNSTKSVTNTAIISVSHTHNLVYFKNKDYFIKNRTEFRLPENGKGFTNPDNDPRGVWKADPFQVGGWRPNQQYEIVNPNTGVVYKPNEGCSWKNDFKKFQELLSDNRIVFGVDGKAGPQRKRFLFEAEERGKVAKTIWDDVGTTTNGTQHLNTLLERNLFANPKPESLIQRVLELATKKNDIILDFFSGSGTTGAVAHKMNRRYILVEQMDYIKDLPEARLKKVIEGEQGGISKAVNWQGGGDFIYLELAKNNIIYLEKIEGLASGSEAWSLFEELADSIWISYCVDIDKFKEHKDQFLALELEDQKKILKDIINYNHLYVNYEDMEDIAYKDCGLSTEDKALTTQFYEKKPTDQNELL